MLHLQTQGKAHMSNGAASNEMHTQLAVGFEFIDAVRGVEGVLTDHPVEALFLEFGDSALIFRVRWWLESYTDTRRMFDRVNSVIYHALGAVNIDIPYPHQVIHHQFDTQDSIHFSRQSND